MQVPFPELEVLNLSFSTTYPEHVLPDILLGGSAPRLRYIILTCISFLRLPNFLLSATHLVYLCLLCVPRPGYVSSQTVATCLSILTSLESFRLEFANPHDQESRP